MYREARTALRDTRTQEESISNQLKAKEAQLAARKAKEEAELAAREERESGESDAVMATAPADEERDG